ncbi:MAG: hypothetical protein IMX02_11160 [Limnochordaceae bacterium]|nr:hypothetical protein [Limnochordaceae bacterium]
MPRPVAAVGPAVATIGLLLSVALPDATGAPAAQAAELSWMPGPIAVATRHTVVLFPGFSLDRAPTGEEVGPRYTAVGQPGEDVFEVALAPQGGRLFGVRRSPCVKGRQTVTLFSLDLASGEVRTVRSVESACVGEGVQHLTGLVVAPAGDRVAWALTGVEWSGWEMARADGRAEPLQALPPEDSGLCGKPGEFYGGWPLAWSDDGRSLWTYEFGGDGQTTNCVQRIDVAAGTRRVVFSFLGTVEDRRAVRGSLSELVASMGLAARGLYSLRASRPDAVLMPLGSGLRRPKELWSPDGRWRVARDWGDLVLYDARGREAGRLIGVVPAPPLCGEVCVDPDDLWSVAWRR